MIYGQFSISSSILNDFSASSLFWLTESNQVSVYLVSTAHLPPAVLDISFTHVLPPSSSHTAAPKTSWQGAGPQFSYWELSDFCVFQMEGREGGREVSLTDILLSWHQPRSSNNTDWRSYRSSDQNSDELLMKSWRFDCIVLSIQPLSS